MVRTDGILNQRRYHSPWPHRLKLIGIHRIPSHRAFVPAIQIVQLLHIFVIKHPIENPLILVDSFLPIGLGKRKAGEAAEGTPPPKRR